MNPISYKNWTGGASLIAGLLLVIAPYRALGQPGPVESPSNIECLERLEIPDYPPLPRQARIQAIQTVKVLLSDQSSVKTVESSLQGKAFGLEKHFREGAEKALKNSRFSRRPVAGRPLRWSFTTSFVMTPTGRRSLLSGRRITFGYGTDRCT
jgi:hypothetical protein